MNFEIEKKYLCKNIPELGFLLANYTINTKLISQYYIPSEDGVDLRYRCVEIGTIKKYFHTVKKGEGLVREEYEEEITFEEFESKTSSVKDLDPILKTRFEIYYYGKMLEIDLFKNEKIKDLILLEVEFYSLEDVEKFAYLAELPFIVSDVTEDKAYSNKELFKKINKK